MAHNAEQGHIALLEQLTAMTRRELLDHCKTIVAAAQSGNGVGSMNPYTSSTESERNPVPSETCEKQLPNRYTCQLPEGHEGECDHDDRATATMAEAHQVEAENLSDFLHRSQ